MPPLLASTDLRSIETARQLVEAAHEAQQAIRHLSQAEVDRIVAAMAGAADAACEQLARMAVEETGFGKVADKMVKNYFASRDVYGYIAPMKTVGVIAEHANGRTKEIAEPMGVVVALIPSTNPTSTTIYKALISVKSRNAVVMSPHPKAARCIGEATRIMAAAAEAVGAPKGLIACHPEPTLEATDALMKHRRTAVILATGSSAMVKAAYSAGTPAYGVGPGNVPAFIHRTADVPKAVADIVASKTFDWGTICASEQAIVCDLPVKPQVLEELKKRGAHFVSGDDKAKLERFAVPGGRLNPAVVGKSPQVIGQLAGIAVPPTATVLIAELDGVGRDHPLSVEKLSPILAFYTTDGWEAGCERCMEILNLGGVGHSLVIHTKDDAVALEFGLKKPAFRILVNTPATQGAIGFTTGLAPAMTLGCGTWGGSITSDNLTPMHLLNIKRLAYEVRSLTERADDYPKPSRTDAPTSAPTLRPAAPAAGAAPTGPKVRFLPYGGGAAAKSAGTPSMSSGPYGGSYNRVVPTSPSAAPGAGQADKSTGRNWMDEIDSRIRAKALPPPVTFPNVPVEPKKVQGVDPTGTNAEQAAKNPSYHPSATLSGPTGTTSRPTNGSPSARFVPYSSAQTPVASPNAPSLGVPPKTRIPAPDVPRAMVPPAPPASAAVPTAPAVSSTVIAAPGDGLSDRAIGDLIARFRK